MGSKKFTGIRLDEEELAFLRELGKGKISTAVRELIAEKKRRLEEGEEAHAGEGEAEAAEEAVTEEDLPVASSFQDLLVSSEGELEEVSTEQEAGSEPTEEAGRSQDRAEGPEDFAELITRELEHELSASEGKSQETGDTSSTETFDDLDVLSGVEDVLRDQLEGEPENGKGEVSASDEGEMVSFVDLVRSIEEELSYVSQAPPPVPPRV